MKISPLLLLLLAGYTLPLHGDVTMPAVFGDHMVLQQDAKVPVWGWANPGEAVTVSIGDITAKTTADASGNWRVDFAALPAASDPLTVVVTGKNRIAFIDVLLGDVWLASGQSNMGLPLKDATDGWDAIKKADDDQLRIFSVTRYTPTTPQRDILPPAADQPLSGKWLIADRTTLPRFSAVAYFFGSELRKNIKRPIGLIHTSWGGTTAQAWTSVDALPEGYVRAQKQFVAGYPAAKEKFTMAQAAYLQILEKWRDEVSFPYEAALIKWEEDCKQAKQAGKPNPVKPKLALPEPLKPANPDQTPTTPASLFNGMVNPLIPYAIKGTIWYQGESNSPADYTQLFQNLIVNWRAKWGQGDFPFVFVQLPNYDLNVPVGTWPKLREAQAKALALPRTAMAVTIDIGEPQNIHPRDKADVGHRLALAAQAVAYDQPIVSSGPIYNSMVVEGKSVRLKFKNIGTGLIKGKSPLAWRPAEELTGFVIAGADQQWKPAKAIIDGHGIVVSSAEVPAPVAVRYAWENNPSCNLYNKEMLPAAPFRTDAW